MTTNHKPFTMCVTIPLDGKPQVVDTCPEVLTFANSMIPAHVKGKIISWEVVSGKVKFNVTHYSQELAHALKTHVLHMLPEILPSSPNYSYTPKGCDNGTNVVALGCTGKSQLLVQGDCLQSPPEGVRLMDFRSSIGVYDKSTPHGTSNRHPTVQAFRLHSHSIPNPPSMTENLVKTLSLEYKQAVSAELKGYLSKANDLMYAMQAHFKELHDIRMSGEAIPHDVEQDYFKYRHELHCQRNEALSSAEVLTKLLAVL